MSDDKSPHKLVRDFCREHAICTRCKVRWAMNGENTKSKLCARCYAYAINAPSSLARAIMREAQE